MKKEDFNQWEGFENITIPHGKTIALQVLGIVDDPIPENKGQKIIPNANVRPTCTIFRNGKTYNMAAIESVDVLGNITLSHIFFSGSAAGVIRLQSGNAEDERKWKYLSICDENESNEHRNMNITPVFRVLDVDKETETLFDNAKKVNDAKNFAFNAEESAVRAMAKELQIDGNNINDLRLKISKLADTAPGLIVSTKENKVDIATSQDKLEKNMVASVKKAIKDGLFLVDKENQKVTYSKDVSIVFEYFGQFSEAKLLEFLREKHTSIIDELS